MSFLKNFLMSFPTSFQGSFQRSNDERDEGGKQKADGQSD